MSEKCEISPFCIKFECKDIQGTGVLIKLNNSDKDIIITAAHCLAEYKTKEDITFDFSFNFNILDVWINDIEKEIDIAVIIIEKFNDETIPLYILDDIEDISDKHILIYGYPVYKKDNDIKYEKLEAKYYGKSKGNYRLKLNENMDTFYSDGKSLIDGMSGSPAYILEKDNVYLLGVFNRVEHSDLAYNEVNIISIKSIIEKLEHENLIYCMDVKNKSELNIKFTNSNNTDKHKNVSILVIGSSGSGKSTFIKSFSKHEKLIDASGEGQTTRTNIEYNFFSDSKKCKPHVKIKYLNKADFVELRMMQIKEKLESNIKRKIDSFKENELERKLFHTLLQIDGFFSYKEFDFEQNISANIYEEFQKWFSKGRIKEKYSNEEYKKYIINKNINLDNEDKKDEEYELEDIIELFYRRIFDICKEAIKNFPEKIELKDDMDIETKNKLTYCLKVCEGDNNKISVTGMISKVIIKDNICDIYKNYLKRLNINKLTLIDTYGLDQNEALSENLLKDRLPRIFKDYDNIETVFYIRKLNSASPSDLSTAIPVLYDINPKVILYMIFTEIDKNDLISSECNNNPIIDLIELNKKKTIKAVEYFLEKSDDYYKEPHSIKQKMGENKIPKPLIESTYKVLIENLIPYCAKLENINYKENNKYHIEKLLKAIVNKEHLGTELISINNIVENIEKDNAKAVINNLLRKMFAISKIEWYSGNSGHGHWRTQEANITRIRKGELGYWGTYCDLWSQRFLTGYNEVFSKLSEDDVLNLFDANFSMEQTTPILKLFNEFSRYFIGCKKLNLTTFTSYESHCKNCSIKNKCFKELLLNSYTENELSEECKDRVKWLNDRYNFDKRFEIISQKIYLKFKDTFLKEFINECRSHNARIISDILKKDDKISFSKVKQEIANYFKDYDLSRESREFKEIFNNFIIELKLFDVE
ncbi:hypothetical protein [Clostridium sp. ZS2-4]|uniref:hypothetical protein n=1 Tax=Clostridium sp. ZS2-4 TaxID=2987703 RepID=UPI002279F633|nr:hypothetical protein [Clostridium sp. ZS2-4]MCY6353636.1 hypothetical protein [Clostridium sp. ZS2-4]